MLKVDAIQTQLNINNKISFKGGSTPNIESILASSDPETLDAFIKANQEVLYPPTNFIGVIADTYKNLIQILFAPPTPEVQAEMDRIEDNLDKVIRGKAEIKRRLDLAA